MDTFRRNVRSALRNLLRCPGFTTFTVLTLALACGTATAAFSVVYGVLLRPLPYPAADRLVRLSEEHSGANAPLDLSLMTNETYHAWKNPRTIEGIAAYNIRGYTIGLPSGPRRVAGAAVSPALFSILGQTPQVGRFFSVDGRQEQFDYVIVISDRVWREEFYGSVEVVGQTLRIDNQRYTVIGVAQPGFAFPTAETLMWTPYVVAPVAGTRRDRRVSSFYALARLMPGVTVEQAETEGTAAARSTGERPISADALFGNGGPVVVRVRPLVQELTMRIRPALLVATASVTLLLLVACANVANLLLLRGLTRHRELGIRAALGASRGRLLGWLLTESSLLAAAGCLVGLFIAWMLLRALPLVAPDSFPRLTDIRLDFRSVVFANGIAVLTLVLAGCLSVRRHVRADAISLRHAMHIGDTEVRRRRRLHDVLIIGEAAVAVVLIIAGTLLTRSFVRLTSVDPGYNADHVLTATVYLPSPAAAPERNTQFLHAILDRVRGLPGVMAAGGGNMMPFADSTYLTAFEVPSDAGQAVLARATTYSVTPGYAEALGLRLREGRFLKEEDERGPDVAAVVNTEFVRLYLREGPIVGRRFPDGLGPQSAPVEIVGVADNVLQHGLDKAAQPEIYFLVNHGLPLRRELYVVVRTVEPPLAFANVLRTLAREVDPSAAMNHIAPLSQLVQRSVGEPRLATIVVNTVATLGLLLAAIGLYGVLAHSVAQRRRELGIRLAMGAKQRDLLRLVVGEGMVRTVAGLVVGAGAAALLTRFMAGVLFGVTPLDSMAFAAGAVVLLPVGFIACVVPGWRAAVTDPVVALRTE